MGGRTPDGLINRMTSSKRLGVECRNQISYHSSGSAFCSMRLDGLVSSYITLLLLVSICHCTMSALTRIATYRLSARTSLCIAQGSVVDFSWDTNPKQSAIVNAANEECLGGGGVDGAITTAGGSNLAKDRKALPKRMGVRCFTGDAKRTGPGDYGTLHVPYVIHAVGPNYNDCSSLNKGDDLLRSAYKASLERAQEAQLQAVAFALLSAGVYRGKQSVHNVLRIAVTTIQEWAQKDISLTHVFLCGFSSNEVDTLVDICNDLNLKSVVPDDEL